MAVVVWWSARRDGGGRGGGGRRRRASLSTGQRAATGLSPQRRCQEMADPDTQRRNCSLSPILTRCTETSRGNVFLSLSLSLPFPLLLSLSLSPSLSLSLSLCHRQLTRTYSLCFSFCVCLGSFVPCGDSRDSHHTLDSAYPSTTLLVITRGAQRN